MFKYDPNTREASVARAYTLDPLRGFGPVDVRVPGTKVRPWNLSVQAFGLPTPAPGTTEFDGEKLGLKTKPLAKGAYQLGFMVSDLAGNVAVKQTRANVDVKQDDGSGGGEDGSNASKDPAGTSSGSITCGVTDAPVSNTVTLVGALAALVVLRARRRKS
jgi:hypothetical protein